MPQLDLHEGQRLHSLLGLENPVSQLHRQAPGRAAAAPHLRGHPLAGLARLPALGRLRVGRLPGVQVGLRGHAQHDLGVDARGHEGAFQALQDLLPNHRDGIVVRPEDELSHDGVLPEDREVLREERRVKPRGRTIRERGHPLRDSSLLVLEHPDHTRCHVADAPPQRLERDGEHQLRGDVLPALVPVNTSAPRPHCVEHQR
mmetsp:Transcript_28755/g.78934  ORF Transcript_28755/g.78934 Transcript_28755/m.78934 type:complete len:202 (-) Transcript_28755:964-1569(-)